MIYSSMETARQAVKFQVKSAAVPTRLGRRFLCCLALLAFGQVALAQDRITYLDRASRSATPQVRNGSVSAEDPGKVVLTSTDNRRLDIPAADVLDVQYEGEPTVEMNAARAAERDKKYDAALAAYSDALKKTPADKRLIRRHLEYKLAELRTAQADAGGPAAPAIAALRQFFAAHSNGRQSLACLDNLGRLLIVSRQSPAEVADGLAQMRGAYGNDNQELANRCDLLRGDLLSLDVELAIAKEGLEPAKKKLAETLKALQELKRSADRTVVLELSARETFCLALLGNAGATASWESQLKAADDPRSKASVHLARGDYYRLLQKYKEAMWDYLWVDTVYFAEREQQAKALYHLVEVFEKLGDSPKAREAKERLQADPRLKDTRYQKLGIR
jgi:hypothetical protein